ncbi:hypothetical protein CQW23_23477 [Capsicum baccatum]|uniref:TOD1/MUCI70 glycosyltransferase-like domain-containing protein n=1 Tax=Capsicum baccatum TaxID=33114 RepID=A0A2G2VS17_CAPBA|nr:hypothetical protein CQW23_23477 [Capsicum baccatum]
MWEIEYDNALSVSLFWLLKSSAIFNFLIVENAQELNPSLSNRLFNPEAGQKDNSTNIESVERTNVGQSASTVQPPPPPVYFKGYTLPPGNPCEGFTLPPPPADKKRTGPRPCPVCYLPIEQAIVLMPDAPSSSPGVSNLTYIHEETSRKPEFGGYPSLMQRNDSYEIRESMSVHCGFVKGIRPGHQTDFDIDDSDLHDMEFCRGVVVASAIFGAFDLIREPKNISDYSKKNVCFHMFVDEQTEVFVRNSSVLDGTIASPTRLASYVKFSDYLYLLTFQVPKLLLHRLFPNARYSLGIDAKLELVVDPYQILERFLWRKNASFAISRHYRHFDVFVEAEANKASYVPEGCVVVREHIPISNLFACLWFNEVDRFTPRDQISFAIVRDKIMSKTNWTVNMFLDCERLNFVIQGYHRDILENWASPPPPGATKTVHPPAPVANKTLQISGNVTTSSSVADSLKKVPSKRGRDRKSKRHRKVIGS